MIELKVEGYCQTCLDFTPDVIRPERVRAAGEDLFLTNTIVQCEYRKRCENIRRYLMHQKLEDESNEKES